MSILCAAALSACGGGSDEDERAMMAEAEAREQATEVMGWTAGTTACDHATGRVLEVGPGKAYAKPSAAASAAQSGDVIRIAKGDYHGDVATWTDDDLTICGVGGRARLFAAGKSAQGKAIWVVSGRNITIDSVEFHQTKVKDRNGAGIRSEHTGKMLILNSGFYDNQAGILGAKGAAEVEIHGSEFARNGYGDGYSHNLYIGTAAKLTVRSSYFHQAKVGHNLKSRAAINSIENSYFVDGPTGTASYQVDFPDGGHVQLRGNMFHKGPKAQNSTAISYGAERSTWSTNRLVLSHNTVVMTRPGGHFVRAPASTSSVVFNGNVFAGTKNPGLITGGFPLDKVVQKGNVITQASHFPGASNTAAPDFWPVSSQLPALALGEVLDPQYLQDAPSPYQTRAVVGSARLSGALQSSRSGTPVAAPPVPPVVAPPVVAPPAPPVATPPVVTPPVVTPPAPPVAAPPVVKPPVPPVTTQPTPPATTPQLPPVTTRPTPPATTPQVPPVTTRPTPPATTPQLPPVATRPTPPATTPRVPPVSTRPAPVPSTRPALPIIAPQPR